MPLEYMRSLAAQALLCERPDAIRNLLQTARIDIGLERLETETGSPSQPPVVVTLAL